MIIDHRFTDSCDVITSTIPQIGFHQICGIVLTPQAIRICESVVNFKITTASEVKRSCSFTYTLDRFKHAKMNYGSTPATAN